MESALDDLIAAKVGCAPHVLRALWMQLDGDAVAIRQVAETLTPAQRSGMRPLPLSFPSVPSISVAFDSEMFDLRDRELLLAVAVRLDDRLDPILAFDGRTATELVASAAGAHVRLCAGRIELVDQRLAVWVQSVCAPDTVRTVHERLSEVFGVLGDQLNQDWHRARASPHGDPGSAPELIRVALTVSEEGDPLRALQLATEAASHATGADRDEAELIAGVAAAGAGMALEASSRLGRLFPDASERRRLRGFGGLFCAHAFHEGAVPGVEPSAFRPQSAAQEDWNSWTRAAAFAAVLCAERGDRRGMRSWLDALREGSARIGAERSLRDPAVALSRLLVGDPDAAEEVGAAASEGDILGALRAALAGDIDGGVRMLRDGDPGASPAVDAFIAGFGGSPVARAYRAVTESLLLTWRGDLGIARDRLIAASFEVPVALPFAGLGVVLARRLDLAVLGRLGPVARALTTALPTQLKVDLLVDRSIRSFLAGAFDDAESSRRLWLDLGSPQTRFFVPGIDDGDHAATAPEVRSLRPDDLLLAGELERRAVAMGERSWRMQHEEICEQLREVRSTFARAQVESVLGVQCAIRDDHAAARAHLRAAVALFQISGATAWARSTNRRLERWSRYGDPDALPAEAMSACRRAWSAHLTGRELEAAMLAVGGATNRQISERLDVSIRTVEVHLGRVFTKVGVRTRVELTGLAHRINRHA